MEKTHYTEWAAVWAAAAELTRRSYDVGILQGRTPKIDLLCSVQSGKELKVQVKGVSSLNSFYVQSHFFKGEVDSDLYFIIVYVPEPPEPLRFFIISHEDLRDADNKWCQRRIAKGYYRSICPECCEKENLKKPMQHNDGKERQCASCGKTLSEGVVLTNNKGIPYSEDFSGALWSAIKSHENDWEGLPRDRRR